MNELAVISKKIIALPGRPLFMLDSDVAGLYETETRAINQAVRRNPERFPEDFYFELTAEEFQKVVTDCDQFTKFEVTDCDLKTDGRGGRRTIPFGFTREGCNMLSAVLSTPVAVARSVQIMRAFSSLERSRSGGGDAPPSPLLPNGWQMYELRMTYGTDGAKKIMADLYGVGLEHPPKEITPSERHVISFQNPNVSVRNHMIWELVTQRGVSQTKVAEESGLSRNSINAICNKINHIRTKALAIKR